MQFDELLSSVTTLEPALIWGVFTRMIGLVLSISFTSLLGQVVRNAGSKAPIPAATRLAKIREDFPTWRRFLYFPTLLWVSDRDWMLRLLNVAGLVAALSIVVGGPHTPYAFVVCYLAYLSLDFAIALIFPWDCMMFEVILLGILLPPLLLLPEVAATAAPAPLLTWAYRIAIFRLMFGFGKIKFLGSNKDDTGYLKGFLTAQPLPSPLGWYAQKLPVGALKLLLYYMFIVEIPVPFFVFFPGWLSIVAAVTIILLMIGIQSMGSFGYFSLLTISVCLTLFDNTTPTQLDFGALFSPGAPMFTNAFVIAHTIGAFIVFPFNSWVGQSWSLYSFWFRIKPQILVWPITVLRWLHPFRWLHPYGVFPPKAFPGMKGSVVIQVSWDNQSWHECHFNYFAYHPKSKPRFIAPHHPREDQAVIYEAFGMNPNSLISSLAGPYDPYPYGCRPGASLYLQTILDGFPIRCEEQARQDGPPKYGRILTVMLEPATIAEHRATGDYWKRSYIGPHTPTQTFEPDYREWMFPEPELWHWESIVWRRRSKLRAVLDAARAGEDPSKAVLADGPPLSADDVGAFWNEFVPTVGLEDRENWDNLPKTRARLFEKFDRAAMRRHERLLGRFSAALAERLEPHYLGQGFSNPEIPAQTYLHLWMLIQHVIGKGRDAYEAVYRDPLSAVGHLTDMTLYTGMYYLCIFRFEQMSFDAQKLRLIRSFLGPYPDPEPPLTPAQQKVVKVLKTLWGYWDVAELMAKHFKGPEYDGGFPERYPKFEVADSHVRIIKRPEEIEVPEPYELPVV